MFASFTSLRSRLAQLPLRLRLSLWYTLSLGLILFLFTTFLYVQVRRSLIAQVDAALHLAANQAILSVGRVDGELSFQTAVQNPEAIRNLSDDFVIYLIAGDETVWDIVSNEDEIPAFAGQPSGFKTQSDEGDLWRVYRQAIQVDRLSGWVQVAQELEPVLATAASLQTQVYAGLPLALLLAGLGGYFLASRALQPIVRITQTARAISASDLNQRLHYQGPDDEVGRLAATFDTMLDRLQTAFERERRFTGDAAHELRTPLAALKGRIGVTLSQPRQPQAYRQTLQEMEGQVDRLIRLSGDLLFIARLDQGRMAQPQELIDVRNFLGALLDQIRPLAAAKSITLTETIPAGLALPGNMDLLIRLFLNLLDNAVKYTPENGRVAIQVTAENPFIRIAISDTGPGIAGEHLPFLFERFYRVESHRARHLGNLDQGGAGLGLAIASEIARAHGGHLTVHSELDQGTTFIVQLPANHLHAGRADGHS